MSTTRRRPARRVAVLVPVLLAGAALSGCGTDDQPRPGLAATVEGTDISLSRVDDATTQYCTYYGEDETGQAQPYPRAFQRQQVAGTFILQAAFEQILDERGLSVAGEYDAAVADIRAQVGDRPDSEALLEFLEANEYVSAAVSAVGLDEEPPDVAEGEALPDATQLGADAVVEWLRTHEVEINPVVDLTITEEGLVPAEGEDLSVPVSDEARAGVLDFEDPAIDDRVAGLVETLPADQVCGA